MKFHHNQLYFLDLKNLEISKELNRYIGKLDSDDLPEGFIDTAGEEVFDHFGGPISLVPDDGLFVYVASDMDISPKQGLSLKDFMELINYILKTNKL